MPPKKTKPELTHVLVLMGDTPMPFEWKEILPGIEVGVTLGGAGPQGGRTVNVFARAVPDDE